MSPELIDLIQKMLVKDPRDRIKLQDIKIHSWVTGYGIYPMMKQESNCCLIEVTEDDVENSVKSIPKLDTLILVKVIIFLVFRNITIILTNILSTDFTTFKLFSFLLTTLFLGYD